MLATLADGTSVATAMVVGGLICAAAAPLYIPAFRAERRLAAATASGPGTDDEDPQPRSEVSDFAA